MAGGAGDESGAPEGDECPRGYRDEWRGGGGTRRALVGDIERAGPAFEGVKISCGTMASDGAINHVEFDGEDLHSARWGSSRFGACAGAA